jgi:hypothetical protein
VKRIAAAREPGKITTPLKVAHQFHSLTLEAFIFAARNIIKGPYSSLARRRRKP